MDDIMSKTCCFTGHRVISKHLYQQIANSLECEIVNLIGMGVRFFGCGGALGFDTLAAQVVLKIREKFKHIKLIMVLPCRNQSEKWNSACKAEYERILKSADKIVYISEEYTISCMLERNRHLVDNSAFCIAYAEKKTGGTAYTVQYARQKGIKIIFI